MNQSRLNEDTVDSFAGGHSPNFEKALENVLNKIDAAS